MKPSALLFIFIQMIKCLLFIVYEGICMATGDEDAFCFSHLQPVLSVCRETHASVCSVCGLSGRGSQDHLHQMQVPVGWQLAPAGHHVHLRHPGCLSLLSGWYQLGSEGAVVDTGLLPPRYFRELKAAWWLP